MWKVGIVDKGGPWGLCSIPAPVWWNTILPKLRDFESMTWAAIMSAAGGRARGSNSHPVEVGKCSRKARDRLGEIDQFDVSELFSLRLDGTKRIYGIRDGRALKLLWYDPHHGDRDRAVYPVQGR